MHMYLKKLVKCVCLILKHQKMASLFSERNKYRQPVGLSLYGLQDFVGVAGVLHQDFGGVAGVLRIFEAVCQDIHLVP